MSTPTALPGKGRNTMLAILLWIAVAAPVALDMISPIWLPDWSGAAVAMAALVGALLVCWKTGALRARFLAGFVSVLALVAAFGWWRAVYG